MMDKYSTQKEDEKFRQILTSARIEAPENLRHRIMQQIETEKALVPQGTKRKKERENNMLREMGAIFGTMYAVLGAMVAGVYFLLGEDFLLSPQFIGSAILVGSIFSLLWLISRLDSHLRETKKIR
ncbi:hypothetical protein [Proteiniphilum sp. UBA1028]|uniref:hypothetical protein n=1 Tax=Proteiniphilum sp. UBA1028 TaxID=1947251 RepID=UPI0025CDDE11|nr:hypothetical protein [Proteiniphilum sp. UBA1028]